MTCLGVRWKVQGDANRNARVTVRYREAGAGAWRTGLPLFRVDPRKIAYGRKVPDMFAGTIFDLRPGAAYEVKLEMTDPDGGGAVKTLTARTRPVPRAAADARVIKCAAAEIQKRFNEAEPGDVLEVADGTFRGTLDVRRRKGTAARPIVIRAARPGAVTLDGQGGRDVVNARGARYVYLEGLVLKNARGAAVNAEGAVGLVVRRCRIEKVKQGFYNADKRRPGRDFYISDNVIIGPYRWPTMGIKSEEGVQLCGTGHVVCFNRIRGWSDGISILDARGAPYPAAAIDFYNNDISECTDDAIEMDTGQHNIRAFRNRITDCHAGITNQPIYGGPCYIIRNVMYNLSASPLKMHNRTSGLVILHNTVIRGGSEGGRAAFLHYTDSPVYNALFRNNLFLSNGGRAIESWGNFIGCDLDYNGYNKGEIAFTKDSVKYKGSSFAEFTRKTGLEKHSTVVDLSVFSGSIKFPKTKASHEPPALILRAASVAVDRGAVLPNINDGYAGEAPDLGAYELGSPLPHYGPRPKGVAGEKPGKQVEATKMKSRSPIPPGQEDRWTPRLSFDAKKSAVRITVPAIPDTGCTVWCYEDQFGKAVEHRMEGNVLVLVHKSGLLTATSRFTPSPGGVEHRVVIEGPSEAAVRKVHYVNPCMQFGQGRGSAPAFGWDRANHYVDDYVARCFVFLEGGLTLLKDTKRVPGMLPESNRNASRVNADKPWIQEYYPVWEKHPGQKKGQRGYSTDRPVYPIIGVTSRDGKFLAATAWPETFRLGQVWMPCIHPRPWVLKSYDGRTRKTISRGKYYFLPNDGTGQALVDAFLQDFPDWKSVAHRPKKWR